MVIPCPQNREPDMCTIVMGNRSKGATQFVSQFPAPRSRALCAKTCHTMLLFPAGGGGGGALFNHVSWPRSWEGSWGFCSRSLCEQSTRTPHLTTKYAQMSWQGGPSVSVVVSACAFDQTSVLLGVIPREGPHSEQSAACSAAVSVDGQLLWCVCRDGAFGPESSVALEANSPPNVSN